MTKTMATAFVAGTVVNENYANDESRIRIPDKQKLRQTFRFLYWGMMILGFMLCTRAQAATPSIQALPSWQRLTTSSVKGTNYPAIYAAKGEVESFQVGVWGSAGNYTVSWNAPAGLTVKAYEEKWVYTARTSSYYPDGLRPLTSGGAITLDGAKPGAVWFDVAVGRTTAAGAYTVTVNIGGATASLTVNVWNFLLPEQPQLKSAIGLYPTRGRLGTEKLLLEHRLMAMFIDPDHIPTLAALGQTTAHVGGYATMSGTTVLTPAPSSTTVNSWVAEYAPLAPYSYVQDEEYNTTALANLNTYSRNMVGRSKRMMTTTITSASAWLDIVCSLPKLLTDDLIESRVEVGKEVWHYQTLSQDTYTPKFLLHYDYPNWVLMSGFLPYRHKLTGLLYWRADYEKSGYNIWTTADAYGSSYPREASWILPLKSGLPSSSFADCTDYAPTIRLKWLRDGVDTYDMLRLLVTQGQRSFADSVTATVAPDYRYWSKTATAIEAARRQLGDRLSSGSVTPHTLTVGASVNPTSVNEGATALLSAWATDSLGHSIASWSWTDNSAGGTFSPSRTAQSPSYSAPSVSTATTVRCTVMATCNGSTPLQQQASATLTVQPVASGHSVAVSASASPIVVSSRGTISLSATCTDTDSHSGFAWQWTDNGAGGTFSSSTKQNPTWTAPSNTSGSPRTYNLTVTSTCKWVAPWVVGSANLNVTVNST